MKDDSFLDRDPYRTEVLKWLAIEDSSPMCIVIAGGSGVGKSSFTNHVSSKDKRRLYVRVSIPSNVGRTLQAGSYLRRIAIELDTIIQKQSELETFEDRSKKLSRKSAIRDVASSALDIILTKKARKLIISTHEKWTGTGASDWRKKLLGNASSELSDIRQYLTDIFQLLPIGLVIENAQNIDEYSLSWIESVAALSDGHAIFLEWTTIGSSDSSDLRDILNLFKPYCHTTEMIWLQKLPLSFAIQVIPEDRLESREWLASSYGMWDGNLIPLVDLNILVTSTNELISDDSNLLAIDDHSAEKFKALSHDQQIVLSVILLSGGQIGKETLLGCLGAIDLDYSVIELNSAIEELARKRLLQPSPGSVVSIRHDSIVNDLAQDLRFVKTTTLAASGIRSYCEKRLAKTEFSNSEFADISFFLLQVQLYLDDVVGAISSIENICTHKATSHSPSVLCDALLDIVALCKRTEIKLPTEIVEHLVQEVLCICIRNRIFAPTENILDLIETPSKSLKLLEALVLLGTEKSKQALALCNLVIKYTAPDSHLSQSAQIISYVADRHLGLIDEGKSNWYSLQEKLTESNSKLAAYVLRNAEMFLSPRASIPFIISSIKAFKHQNNEAQFAYSLNALSGQLLRIKKFKWAKTFFQKALSILDDMAADSLSVENNLAIANVRLNNLGSETLALFERAAIGSNNSFPQLSIANNLTSYYFLIGDEKQAKKSIKITTRLMQRNAIASPQVNRSIYQSLVWISNEYNDPSLIALLKNIDIELDIEPDVYNNKARASEINSPSFIILTNWYPDPEIVLSPSPEVL